MTAPLLQVEGLVAGYGGARVLNGFSIAVDGGACVSLLGRNGMGKTTAIRSMMGLVAPSEGSVRIAGTELAGAPPHVIARAGLGLVPEGRQVFANLSVAEHVAAFHRRGNRDRWTPETVLALFPALMERRDHRGLHLSGGEQQMLAIARALVTNPRLLILDEATEGLAPLVRDAIWSVLATLKDAGEAILIVDKNVAALSRLADRHAIVEKGRVVWEGDSAALADEPSVKARYLAV